MHVYMMNSVNFPIDSRMDFGEIFYSHEFMDRKHDGDEHLVPFKD